MDTEGDQLVVNSNDDLDDFFAQKDRKKKERLAQKKNKKKTDMATRWKEPDMEPAAEPASKPEVDEEEELSNKLQEEAQIYGKEDDDWLDPDREFAPVRRKQDKLLMMVAPTAEKVHDMSEMEQDKLDKSDVVKAATTGSKSWSKVSETKTEEAPPKEESEVEPVEEEKKPEPPKPEPVVKAAPVASDGPSGYVPPHMRQFQAPAAAPPAPRPPPPAPVFEAKKAEPAVEPGGYVPPHMRSHQSSAQSAPSPFASRGGLAGSGLAAQKPRVPVKEMPNLESAEDFPTLG